MISEPGRTSRTWRQALAVPAFSRALVVAVIAGVILVLSLPHFFQWIEGIPGASMHDPVLTRLGPWEVSIPTFTVLYGCLLVVLINIAKSPLRILHGLYAYIGMMLLRMIAMATITLEPPSDIIPLIDPLTQAFYPGNAPFLKDLFFSGHTATLVLMALLAPKGTVRLFAWICAALVGTLVLVQHVHWTVDVLVAVPAAWVAWKSAGILLRKWVSLPF